MNDFADLYGPARGRPWLATLTEEQREWVTQLAGFIREEGREPTVPWNELHRRFAARWPEASPRNSQTLKDCVRRLVAE